MGCTSSKSTKSNGSQSAEAPDNVEVALSKGINHAIAASDLARANSYHEAIASAKQNSSVSDVESSEIPTAQAALNEAEVVQRLAERIAHSIISASSIEVLSFNVTTVSEGISRPSQAAGAYASLSTSCPSTIGMFATPLEGVTAPVQENRSGMHVAAVEEVDADEDENVEISMVMSTSETPNEDTILPTEVVDEKVEAVINTTTKTRVVREGAVICAPSALAPESEVSPVEREMAPTVDKHGEPIPEWKQRVIQQALDKKWQEDKTKASKTATAVQKSPEPKITKGTLNVTSAAMNEARRSISPGATRSRAAFFEEMANK